MEEFAANAAAQEVERRQGKARRAERWYSARAAAVLQFKESHRADALAEQLTRFRRAVDIEECVEAMRAGSASPVEGFAFVPT